MNEAYVISRNVHPIITIEFFHPQSNSLPVKILDELANAIINAGEDKECHVVILRSGGEKVFCSGASFDELSAIRDKEDGLKFFSGFAKVINAMRTCPKFIIGRIQGKCVGGGIGLAASVDYAIATEKSDIKLSELAVGIGPFVVGPAIERKMGLAAFSQLSIDSSSWRSAKWAAVKGLFAEVFESIEEVDTAVNRLAHTLANSNPEAMAEIKKIFWRDTEHWNELLTERAAISGRLVVSDFTRNAISKFKKS